MYFLGLEEEEVQAENVAAKIDELKRYTGEKCTRKMYFRDETSLTSDKKLNLLQYFA